MKTSYVLFIAILVASLLAMVLVIATFSEPLTSSTAVSSLAMQSKLTLPQVGRDNSKVGSTTGIVIMGIAITLIVTLPLYFRKKRR